ncbi:molybdopterin molybdotransferase MoeA [Luteolibacter ambystomatis]|uniref:Molybdopterin molybdenumtransferase n=1 Tax=Luteolibacter ambystomatis TaxID=2824561 RepID=A0A975PEQ6_9BACT|nr:molybdopterin molybdotransferase MoeA [Luteolibacter ambystomatis]QUE51593.1 molybdopterin molybdotransferase MoeA [Luteolibacter ambystomatis]
MNELVTPAEATGRILSNLPVTAIESVQLAHALGRVLRSSIFADRALPPYRRATMDGIAFRGRAPSFRIAGLHAAGDAPPRALEIGEAWEIMTGAIVPEDCDTLMPYEEVAILGGIATLQGDATTGQFIHEVGVDAAAGSLLVPQGFLLGSAEIAIAASVGLVELPVSKHPVITILTTGDEAVPVNSTPQPWQIRRSNGPMLESILRRLGHAEIHHHHVPDDIQLLEHAVDAVLLTSDLILLCGGISKGKRDHVREVIEARLGLPAFHGVFQRPGKPLAFWNGPPPVFALPGNPVSVLATYTRYVRPALLAMQGATPPSPLLLPLASPTESLPKLTWLLPARIVNGQAEPLPPRNSGDFVSIAGATHLLEIPPARGTLSPGALVTAHSL